MRRIYAWELFYPYVGRQSQRRIHRVPVGTLEDDRLRGIPEKRREVDANDKRARPASVHNSGHEERDRTTNESGGIQNGSRSGAALRVDGRAWMAGYVSSQRSAYFQVHRFAAHGE